MSYPSTGGQYGLQRPRRTPLLLAALAGFVVAVLVAVILYFTGALPTKDSSSIGDVSTDAVALPATVGPYVRFQDAKVNQQSRAASLVARSRLSDTRTAQSLAKAHAGAGAAVQTYSDEQLGVTFQIWAVRSASPGLVVPFQDAKSLGLAVPPLRTQRFGAVTCEISTQATPIGQTPRPDAVFTQACLRTGSELTVIFYGGGSGELTHHPEQCAKLVDQVWGRLG